MTATQTQLLTFLIADIRGYTRFTQEHGDDAAARVSEFFLEICREVASAHGGEVFGSAGDQALAAFPAARQALRAAAALQERLAQEQEAHPDYILVAGIGIDTGDAIQIGADYRGGAINLAARLCALAGPGEVFASEGVIHTARKTQGLDVFDRGEVPLKGIRTPVRVMQVAPIGQLPADLPPLPAALLPRSNLPAQPTPFIGREEEVRDVVAMLRRADIRLLTLTGPGGTGKTRLALQAAEDVLRDFKDGAFFVPLAAIGDPAAVAPAIGAALALKDGAGEVTADAIVQSLQPLTLLLLLDNFEQVMEASSLIGDCIARCPGVKVLVTSRMSLHLGAEHDYAVPPLSVPATRRLPAPDTLRRYDAIALFVERARTVKAGFILTEENARAVAEICRRLDGLPLAIELAAARVRLFPPEALLRRLTKASATLQLLTGGARDAPTRQRTLRDTIDWSHSLLEPEEQILFARLSVFAGGCTLEAAESVCNGAGDDVDLLEGIASLVDKSLIRQEEGTDLEPRFVMLETIREYAAERLAQRQEAEAMYRLHAEYYAALLPEGDLDALEQQGGPWLEQLAVEHSNLRAGLQWALKHEDIDLGRRLAMALWESSTYIAGKEEVS